MLLGASSIRARHRPHVGPAMIVLGVKRLFAGAVRGPGKTRVVKF